MWHQRLADIVLLTHAGFVVFVVVGGLAVLRWPRLAWVHVPAVVWGVLIEFAGWVCPLTPLENALRQAGGGPIYGGGFIDHYVAGALYPDGLTRGLQVALGVFALAVNVLTYWHVVRRGRGRQHLPRDARRPAGRDDAAGGHRVSRADYDRRH